MSRLVAQSRMVGLLLGPRTSFVPTRCFASSNHGKTVAETAALGGAAGVASAKSAALVAGPTTPSGVNRFAA
jgi:hypothetical protein